MRTIWDKDYLNVHSWINRNFGKANKCENPNCEGLSNRFHWALKRGEKEYIRDRNKFLMLCARCHWSYDGHGMSDYMRNEISEHLEEIFL